MKKMNKKGFTLAELLIVIAIMAILIAIAIPVFSAQLDSAREAVDKGNIRSAESLATVQYLLDGETGTKTYYFAKVNDSMKLDLTLSKSTVVSEVDNTKTLVVTVIDGLARGTFE